MDQFHKYVGIAYEVLSGVSLIFAGLAAAMPNASAVQTIASKIAALVFDLKKLTGGDQ